MNPAVAVIWTYVQTCWANARTHTQSDEGVVTVENVLWYLAAGLGTVAVAGIIWVSIKNKASEPLPSPSIP
jgi:hypothetical protein